MSYFLLVIYWVLWCSLHSLMISHRVVATLQYHLGETFKFYRLAYNVIALMTFLPLASYTLRLNGPVIVEWQGVGMAVRALLFLAALFLFYGGARRYALKQFLGVGQIRSGKTNATLSASNSIDTSGILAVTRHPWYLAGIFIIWSYHGAMTLSILLVNIIFTIYMLIGTLLEEKKLIHQFGKEYVDYQEKVSMLLPIKWLGGHVESVLQWFRKEP